MSSTRPASIAQASAGALSYENYNNDKALPLKSQNRHLEPSPMPLQPIENNSPTTRDYILDPPSTKLHRPSPTKAPREINTSHSAPAQGKLGFVPISAPTPPMFTTDSPAKKTPYNNTYPHPVSSSARATRPPPANA